MCGLVPDLWHLSFANSPVASQLLGIIRSCMGQCPEKGKITRKECQEALGIGKQYAQNDLFFLYKLGVLDRVLGASKKATYYFAKNSK